MTGKLKKAEKIKKKKRLVANQSSSDNLLEKREENAEDEVYQMSSGDEDYSKGMKSMILVSQKSAFLLRIIFLDKFCWSVRSHETQSF